ncbi:hypothetical protein NT05LI_2645a, partial [Listeria ivanovii FSL F6-596]
SLIITSAAVNAFCMLRPISVAATISKSSSPEIAKLFLCISLANFTR